MTVQKSQNVLTNNTNGGKTIKKNTNGNRSAPKATDFVEQSTGVKKDVPLEIEAAVKGANPKFQRGTPYSANCQRCVQAYEFRRRGYDVVAKPAANNIISWGSECFIQPNAYQYSYYDGEYTYYDYANCSNGAAGTPAGAGGCGELEGLDPQFLGAAAGFAGVGAVFILLPEQAFHHKVGDISGHGNDLEGDNRGAADCRDDEGVAVLQQGEVLTLLQQNIVDCHGVLVQDQTCRQCDGEVAVAYARGARGRYLPGQFARNPRR